MKTISIDEMKANITLWTPGRSVAFEDKDGRVRIGTVRIRHIKCGKKNCTKCPHRSYAYARYREGRKVKEKYIGVAIYSG